MYVTKGGIHHGNELKEFLDKYANKWKKEKIDQRIEDGIQEYHSKTMKLMEKAGVYKSLENMKQRGCSPSEKIFSDMRMNIELAKK